MGTTGTMLFNGPNTQPIYGSNDTWFSRLQIQPEVSLGADIMVSKELLLLASNLNINNQSLIIQTGATISGAQPKRYINANATGKLI